MRERCVRRTKGTKDEKKACTVAGEKEITVWIDMVLGIEGTCMLDGAMALETIHVS